MTFATTLSRREIEVKNALLDGLPNREIAALLGLHVDTIKVYSSKIYRKLGVRGRPGLAAAEISALREQVGRKKRKARDPATLAEIFRSEENPVLDKS